LTWLCTWPTVALLFTLNVWHAKGDKARGLVYKSTSISVSHSLSLDYQTRAGGRSMYYWVTWYLFISLGQGWKNCALSNKSSYHLKSIPVFEWKNDMLSCLSSQKRDFPRMWQTVYTRGTLSLVPVLTLGNSHVSMCSVPRDQSLHGIGMLSC
jgi:hypothetical protein